MAGKNKLVAPVLKWVGGKRQLISTIIKFLPSDINKLGYIEPFVGGGALFFYLQPKKGIINDYNEELINVYKVIRDNCEKLIQDLEKHENNAEYFYNIRALDRNKNYKKLSNIVRASRIIYLNKTCYNGLYRVNNAGEFNTPYGRYKNPNIVNAPTLRAVSKFLNNNNIEILSGDYSNVLRMAKKNCFVYLDPPYHPISESSNFTGYVEGGWSEEDQIRLKKECDELNKKGVRFLLSNSASKFILDLYKDYSIEFVKATRNINSVGTARGEIDEVLIRNYE